MSVGATDRLSLACWEADRHWTALDQAREEWQSLPTPGWQAIEQDVALRRLTDQILFRFMKLQDAMGERLIPATLHHRIERAAQPRTQAVRSASSQQRIK